MPSITPTFFFESQAEEAAEHYVSIFPRSRLVSVLRAPSDGPAGAEGSVVQVTFELDGQPHAALNGARFAFSEALSLEVLCEDQGEVDHYWERLGEGGEHGPCGWLKDRFGVSWQVTPEAALELLQSTDRARASRAFDAMMRMSRLDVAELERAAGAGAHRP